MDGVLSELGRVVDVSFGRWPAVGVDVANGPKVVVDGPGLGVEQAISVRRLELAKFRLGGCGVGRRLAKSVRSSANRNRKASSPRLSNDCDAIETVLNGWAR